MDIALFHRSFELTRVLYALAGLSGIVGTVFGWLAYQRQCRATDLLRSNASRPLLLARLAFEFDAFRGLWFAMFSWCILSIVMALEPRYWIVTVEMQYTAFAGWIVIVTGLACGFGVFAGGQVQDHMGWHPFQQLASLERHELEDTGGGAHWMWWLAMFVAVVVVGLLTNGCR